MHTWCQSLFFISWDLVDFSISFIDVTTFNRLELQVASHTRGDQQLHQLPWNNMHFKQMGNFQIKSYDFTLRSVQNLPMQLSRPMGHLLIKKNQTQQLVFILKISKCLIGLESTHNQKWFRWCHDISYYTRMGLRVFC